MTIRFRSVAPLLQSGDLQRTIDWYESVLGFRCVGREEAWYRLERDRVALMFMRNAHLGTPHATATQYIYLHDLAAFWDEIKDKVKAEWGPEKNALRHDGIGHQGSGRLSAELW